MTKVGLLTPDNDGSGIHAQVFNHQLRIPVLWKRAEKVLPHSGKGFYDYINHSSFGHVLLLEPLKIGRLKRDRGDFLCGKVTVNRHLHELLHMNDVAKSDEYIKKSKCQKVTCKRCLEIAKRFQRSNHNVVS